MFSENLLRTRSYPWHAGYNQGTKKAKVPGPMELILEEGDRQDMDVRREEAGVPVSQMAALGLGKPSASHAA